MQDFICTQNLWHVMVQKLIGYLFSMWVGDKWKLKFVAYKSQPNLYWEAI
jgi:hypothetical protein